MRKTKLDSDCTVKDKLSKELRKSHNTLKEISNLAYQDGRRDVVTHIKDILNTTDLFRNEIDNAAYGLSPSRTQGKIPGNIKQKMMEFDQRLLEKLEVITKAVDLIYDHILQGETSDIILQARRVKRSIDSLRNIFLDRADFLLKQVAGKK